MSASVDIVHHYPVAPRRLWELVTDFAAFRVFGQRLVRIEGMPEEGRLEQGQRIDVTVRLFGFFPPQPYSMHLAECDDDAMRFVSHEQGAGVKHWRHTLNVAPTETGARLTDHIDLDAGWLTPLFKRWAILLYKSRHKPRLRLLNLQD